MPAVFSAAHNIVFAFLARLLRFVSCMACLVSLTANAQYGGVDPASYSSPATSTTGTYFVSWYSPGTEVNVYESKQGVSGEALISGVPSDRGNLSVTRSNGVYTYKFWRCGSGGTNCTLWGTKTTTVTIQGASSSSSSSAATVPPVGVTPAPAPSITNPATPVGSMAGSFRVSEAGSATYSMPISVPAGVAGVAPQLAVTYDSQGGAGLVGVGANISGLGSITRCRQTLLQDGVALPISWNANDRFCLNGQRLMLVSDHAYGAGGSVYRTEIDTYGLITAYGSVTGNPEYFIVENKDGSKSTYGGTTDSKLLAQATMTWALSRFEDNMGNRIDYEYTGNRNDGHRIKTIYYAYPLPKSSSGSLAKVDFEYIARNDVASSFLPDGKIVKNTMLLKSIRTYEGNSLYRRYKFNFNEINYSTYDNLNRLTSAEECLTESSASCYPKTKFEWGHKKLFYGEPLWLNRLPAANKFKTYRFMDIDGDGRQDFVWVRSSGSSRYISYASLNKYAYGGMVVNTFSNGISQLTYNGISDDEDSELQLDAIDYNSDGRQDLLVWRSASGNVPASWDLYLSVPDNIGGWKLSATKITMPFSKREVLFGDLDADGLLDATEIGTDTVVYTLKKRQGASIDSNSYYEFKPALPNKPLVGTPNIVQPPSEGPLDPSLLREFGYKYASLGDFNGDGRLDVALPIRLYKPVTPYCQPSYNCQLQIAELYIYINTGSAFTYNEKYRVVLSAGNMESWSNILKITRLIPHDFNNDGLTDITTKGLVNWDYRLNTGIEFTTPVALTNISSSIDTPDSISLLDYNGDGYTDVIWHDKKNEKLLYRSWVMTEGKISSQDSVFDSTAKSTSSFSMADITGDGVLDRVVQKLDASYNVDISISPGGSSPDVSFISGTNVIDDNKNRDSIYKIIDGNNNEIHISYGSLANSKNYTTLQGVNSSVAIDHNYCTGWSYPTTCKPPVVFALNSASFYSRVNQPFGMAFEDDNPAPVLELNGGAYVVTEVATSAPVLDNPSNMHKLAYHYHHARIQAGGRGYLGFEKLTTIDQQSGVRTETTYHQDWPFTGSPRSTIVTTKEGHKLSEATNTMATEDNSVNARIKRVYLDVSAEVSYSLKNNGATQGASLQTVTTNSDYDDEGNVTRIETITSGSANTARKTVENKFDQEPWAKRMGRLLKTVTKTQRNSDPEITRISEFEYYGKNDSWPGMLKTEIVEKGSEDEQKTQYLYDDVGNKKQTTKIADVKPGSTQTRKTIVEFDTSKRFAKTTKDSLNNVTSGVVSYHPVYGLPEKIRDVNDKEMTIKYNHQGQEVQRSDATGAWTHISRDYCGGAITCPQGARYRVENLVSGGGKSIEYFDVLGRVIRSSKVLFNGHESHVDTEYDNLGRIKRQSTPFTNSETPYWTVYNEYDLLGRVLNVTAPDGTVSTTAYDGYITTITADAEGKKLKRIEERNSLGHLVKVTDSLGGTITYGYDALGNLTSATTVASGKTVRVRMCYDKLGRKIAMHDPDKGGFLGNANTDCSTVANYLTQPAANKLAGWWFYRYNDFGELIEQTDPKKQTTVMEYDALGRMTKRTDRLANGSVDTHTRWYYDKNIGEAVAQKKNQLKLMAVVTSYGTINESCGGSNYCQTYLYHDEKGLLTHTTTYLPNHDTDYISSVVYDSIGRVKETYDVLNSLVGTSGTLTLYNAYGYAGEIRDLATNDVLQKTIKVNSRGQVAEEWRNNGGAGIVTYQYDDKTGAMLNQRASIAGGLFPIQDVTYKWDKLGNLESRWNQSSNVGRTAKKNLQESFCYDGLNRLIKSHVGTLTGGCSLTAANQDIEYDGLGNITRKTGVGTYTYSGKGPHAVTSTTNDGAYNYDNSGNQISGGGRSITYSSYDQPLRISTSTVTTDLSYGPDRARWQRIDKPTTSSQRTLTQYLGNVERIDVEGTNIVEWKRYIAGAIYTVRTTAVQTNGSINYTVQRTDKSYVYNDHLGSLDVVVNHLGQVTHTASFDAWGNRRNAENWTGAFVASSLTLTNYNNPITKRGFTGHEMLDGTGLIHMNGRIFDPRLARFMQADPFIQAAANTQSYNRYSYVWNNPLNATDPSGYFLEKLFNPVGRYIMRPLFKAIGYENSQILISIGSLVVCGPLAPACAAAATYDLNRAFGANPAQSLFAAGLAGMSAMAFKAMGGMRLSPGYAFLAAGMIGGSMAVMQGGEFGHGFLSAGLSSAAGGLFGGYIPDMALSMVIGGSISKMTGGKFANGAATAAFSYAMTWAASKYKPGGAPPDECSASHSCTEKNFSEERQKEVLAKIEELTVDTRAGAYTSAKDAAVALHSNEALMAYAEELGIEFWAVIDKKSFAIKSVGTGFNSGLAEGVYAKTSGFRPGDSVWHTHPSGGNVWSGDIGSIADAGGRWIFASGNRLTGVDLYTTGYTSSNQILRDWGRGNVTMHAYSNGSWGTEQLRF